MLAVVIPALNADQTLAATLKSLEPARASGFVCEAIVSDGGSTDRTVAAADAAGAKTISAARGRGAQLAAGADAASAEWRLFLHADTVLADGWHTEAEGFCADPANRRRAAVFRFALADDAPAARRLEKIVAWRTRALGLPYGDQGLLISREFYRALGGYRILPLMEDVDLVRRVGRRRLHTFDSPAITSAERYLGVGYVPRSARNLMCLLLYFLHVPPRLIARLYV